MRTHRSLLCTLALAAACATAAAQERLTTGTWSGLGVTLISPDYKVIQYTPFDLAFVVDSSPIGSGDPRAFLASLTLSDTVDLSGALWQYTLTSDDPAYNVTFSGQLGDVFTPIHGVNEITLVDPFMQSWWNVDGATMLWPEYRDQVRWDFTNIVIDGNTDVSLRLRDGDITGMGPYETGVLVIDPPAIAIQTPVPEPSSLLMMLAGLGVVGWLGRRRGMAAEDDAA
ncbi:MAG TPA: PEP-CTERM sorting domain-containing protein [Albitalea sp.]